MLSRLFLVVAISLSIIAPAEARRVALVIGQNAYKAGLGPLANPANDAKRVAALFAKHGFEVIACDGKQPGCFDLDRTAMLGALGKLEDRAKGADLALVFYAGHGMATEEGNILAPVDAKVNCETGAVTQGITVERLMAATAPAKHKLLILDACRDNPLGLVCPGLASKKLSFTRIEAGAMHGLLLVTSTQFGQQARDGVVGTNSPFATALLEALENNPGIYFEQVMNAVARTTYEAVQQQFSGFLQIPGKVVGGAAPDDCLAGKNCVGDARMAALAIENERLTADAAGVRNLLAAEERARGKPYTPEERAKRVADLTATLASIGSSSDPLRQEARRRIDAGDVKGGEEKLDEALDADEKAVLEAERVAAEKRKAAAQSARDLGVLARGRDVVKAATYYNRATKLDPADPKTWQDLGYVSVEAGRLDEASRAFEQASLKARDSNNPSARYWASLGLGDVAIAQGSLPSARRLYETAVSIAEPIAKADPGNAGWQRDLSVSHNKIGDVLVEQGNLPAALESYRASLAIRDRLAKADPGNAGWQRDLALSFGRVASVDAQQGERQRALGAFSRGRAIIAGLKAASPDNATLPRDLAWFDAQIAALK